MTASPWIRRPRPRPEAEARLLCVPHAGAGPSFFARWVSELPAAVEVCLVHLPGRESRLAEPPLDDIELIAERVAREARSLLELPFALLGHSMGAIVAFEVAHRIEPRHLIASASAPPHRTDLEPPVGHLPDEEFLAAVHASYAGIPDVLWRDPAALRPLLPSLRADFTAFERYRWRERPALRCPISVLGGADDRSVPAEALSGWCELTTGGCRVRVFEGDHFYLVSARAAVQRFVCELLGVGAEPAPAEPERGRG